MAWKIYLAEIAEEGIDLVEPNKAHELVERCFELARNFLIVRARLTAKPPKPDKAKRENGRADEAEKPQAEEKTAVGEKAEEQPADSGEDKSKSEPEAKSEEADPTPGPSEEAPEADPKDN